jgi:hypothetical protein
MDVGRSGRKWSNGHGDLEWVTRIGRDEPGGGAGARPAAPRVAPGVTGRHAFRPLGGEAGTREA